MGAPPLPSPPAACGSVGSAPGQFFRVRYDGPAALLAVLSRFLRDGDVTLASVYVEGAVRAPRGPGPADAAQRLSLTMLCRGSRASIDSVVRCFLRCFGTQVGLHIVG